MSRFVRMFKPRFAAMVANRTKRQTVRPTPKRMPKPGDIFDARAWTGKPYRTKHVRILESPIVAVRKVSITPAGISIDGRILHHMEEEEFGMADGFSSAREMCDWFRNEHGLPFSGICIMWK